MKIAILTNSVYQPTGRPHVIQYLINNGGINDMPVTGKEKNSYYYIDSDSNSIFASIHAPEGYTVIKEDDLGKTKHPLYGNKKVYVRGDIPNNMVNVPKGYCSHTHKYLTNIGGRDIGLNYTTSQNFYINPKNNEIHVGIVGIDIPDDYVDISDIFWDIYNNKTKAKAKAKFDINKIAIHTNDSNNPRRHLVDFFAKYNIVNHGLSISCSRRYYYAVDGSLIYQYDPPKGYIIVEEDDLDEYMKQFTTPTVNSDTNEYPIEFVNYLLTKHTKVKKGYIKTQYKDWVTKNGHKSNK